ncbi:hypothetical protein [Legionella jamestowniensis]|uniref:Uncharacterized protein n=1 Tax=Legionella jamestowniensis TaxID=455 RepID=A0A0W0UID0_9GAMM|nr:hypothetical protein [Legionella jamestowniensis]KTD07583.1 hypothetical protein Ljam_1778 [Legionella jamestowniensis]OCH99331.1 hypothetical protein A8135_06490 [Legionella jamestowniensis]
MPFFSMQTPEQIRNYCQKQSFDELRNLNHRYGAFFEKVAEQEDLNNEKINLINRNIHDLQKQIADKKEQAEQHRKHVLDSLPGNAAERYLALQTLTYHSSDTSILEQEITELTQQKIKHEEDNAWIKFELHACAQELKIINAVIKEKTPVENREIAPPSSI